MLCGQQEAGLSADICRENNIMDNSSHHLHTVTSTQRSRFSDRLHRPRSKTSRAKKSVDPPVQLFTWRRERSTRSGCNSTLCSIIKTCVMSRVCNLCCAIFVCCYYSYSLMIRTNCVFLVPVICESVWIKFKLVATAEPDGRRCNHQVCLFKHFDDDSVRGVSVCPSI